MYEDDGRRFKYCELVSLHVAAAFTCEIDSAGSVPGLTRIDGLRHWL